MSLPLIFINGKQAHEHSVLDRAFTFGDGVFETLLCIDAKLPLWELHKQRLLVGCQRLHIDIQISELERLLADAQLQTSFAKSVCKITVSRGVGGRGYAVDTSVRPTIVIGFFPFPEQVENLSESGVSLGICIHRLSQNEALAGIKHLNRLDNVLARRECQNRGLEDGVVLDQLGSVVEATSSNLFVCINGQWLTPAITMCGVEGVTRRVVLEELAPVLNVSIYVDSVSPGQLDKVEEAFICNSVNGIVPVVAIDENKMPVGQATRNFQDAYKNFVKEKLR